MVESCYMNITVLNNFMNYNIIYYNTEIHEISCQFLTYKNNNVHIWFNFIFLQDITE